jgi:hypothetical protein
MGHSRAFSSWRASLFAGISRAQGYLDKHMIVCYTFICVEEAVMDKRNLTLSLPYDLVKKAKEMAVREGRSLNDYAREALEEKIGRSSGYAKAMERQLRYLEKGLKLGTEGRKPAKRDDIHERR